MDSLSPVSALNTLDAWTLVIGFLMPNVVALVNQSHWPAKWKTGIAAFACLTAAVIQLSLKNELDATNLMVSTLSIFALSITFFKGFWRPLGVSDAIEARTDVTDPAPFTNLPDPKL